MKFTKSDIEFIENMGLSAQSDGFPRISGQIWGALIVSPDPMSGEQLAESLQISRGSVSTNTRLLITLGVVQLRSIAGDRRDFYGLAEEKPYSAIFSRQAKSAAANASMVAAAQQKTSSQTAKKRMKEVINFYSMLSKSFDKLVKEYDK